MGIKGFKLFMDKNAAQSVTTVPDLRQYSGCSVAIDTAIYMYKAMHYAKHQTGVKHAWIGYFLRHYSSLKEQGLTPVYVFDRGEPLKEKLAEEQKRRESQQKQREREHTKKQVVGWKMDQLMEGSTDLPPSSVLQQLFHLQEQKEKVATSSVLTVTKDDYKLLKAVFQATGVPYVIALAEAEKACSWMAQQGMVELVMTDDYDAVACGAPLIVRHYSADSDFEKRYPISILRLDTLLEQLQLSYEQLVDVCILAGCDFCGTLPKVGIGRGYTAIKRFGSIDNYLQSYQGKAFADNELLMLNFPYQRARQLFMDTDCQIYSVFHFLDWPVSALDCPPPVSVDPETLERWRALSPDGEAAASSETLSRTEWRRPACESHTPPASPASSAACPAAGCHDSVSPASS